MKFSLDVYIEVILLILLFKFINTYILVFFWIK